MAEETLAVVIGARLAGTLVRQRGGQIRLDYDDEYRETDNAVPLSVSMPVQVRTHTDRVVTPWLWGLLPDNDAVIARWAREFHVSASSPFSLLGSPIGEDCAGAARFVQPSRLERHLSQDVDVVWLSEAEVAQRIRELVADTTSWLGRRPRAGHFSLAGAQSKTALLYENGRWGVPSGAQPTSHILKPAVAGFDDHDLNEHLCMEAAQRVGLIAAQTRICRFEDQSVIVVDRYDRIEHADGYLRFHQEDLCQALSVAPTHKYQREGGPSPIDIVNLMRRAMAPRDADEDAHRFIDALAFNWLIGGADAHAKNYSLLLGSGARLAPLYDIASALPYWDEREIRLAMKVGNSYEVYPRRNRWRETARDLGIDADSLLARVVELGRQVPDAFADASSNPEVRELGSVLPARLVDLVDDRARRCVDLLLRDQ